MRQHLDTIPVWDVYKADCECPLCRLRQKNEAMYVDNFLGGSVMEPATRIEVNKKGFCSRHFKQMFDAGNRLGLALMSHTYLKETITRMQENAAKLRRHAAEQAKRPAPARMADRLTKKNPGADVHSECNDLGCGCILCERLDTTMDRYIYTLLYMWKHESEFKTAFKNSKGLCLEHYAQLARESHNHLSGGDLSDFVEVLTDLQLNHFNRLEKELEWFTLKFDYRNQSKPWNGCEDAVERALNKLRGSTIGGYVEEK